LQKNKLEIRNPANGEFVASYNVQAESEVLKLVQRSKDTFETRWSKLPLSERANYFKSLAKEIRAKKSECAKIMALEMGKPVTQGEAEVEKCAWSAELYYEKAETWLADVPVATDARSSYVHYEPLGVVLSIMPWNFPFLQVFRSAIPTLIAGNTVVLRHSNTCPGTAKAIQEIFDNAGFPPYVFTAVITDHQAVTRLIEFDDISGIAFTGSVAAGQNIASQAGRNLKKIVLELGGSDPFIVLDDADLDKAAEAGAVARLLNCGQNCIAGKRFIVQDTVSKEFSEKLVREFERKKIGDPMDPSVFVGPLVNEKALQEVSEQTEDSVKSGARVRIGASRLDVQGSFYKPTVLDNVNKNMRVMREEVFGPVAPICEVSGKAEAISIANESDFGLGASVWTSKKENVDSMANELKCGMVFVNSQQKSDPRMPFGGMKKSGIGREFSKYGLMEFVNVKSINLYGDVN